MQKWESRLCSHQVCLPAHIQLRTEPSAEYFFHDTRSFEFPQLTIDFITSPVGHDLRMAPRSLSIRYLCQ